MIREFRPQDLEQLIPLVQEDKQMSAAEIRERLFENTAWVFDDGAIKGCAAVTAPHSTARGERVSLWLYTAPAAREQGIGSQLWEAVCAHIADPDVDALVTGYRSDRGRASEFFAKRGFSYWFASHLLGYSGPDFPATSLEVTEYHDGLFADYVHLLNEGFYELRRINNIHPHLPFPPGFDREALRSELLEAKSGIFFFSVNQEIVGLAQLGPDYIDDLVVAAVHQRKGYGRRIVQFCVNKLRERGARQIRLGVIDTNRGARKLYESLGFVLLETYASALLNRREAK